MNYMRRFSAVLILTFSIFNFLFTASIANAQDQSSNPAYQDLQNKIKEYSSKLDSLRQQKSSLSSQIQVFDTQIYLTGLQITDTEQKIVDTQKEIEVLTSRIEGLDSSLNYLSKLMLQRVVDGYKRQNVTVFDMLLDSNGANELVNKLKYYKTAQTNNEKLLLQVQETKVNFEDQKKIREDKKVQLDKLSTLLDDQKTALDSQKAQKQQLLAQTGNDETTYQRLLANAQAQLASFGRFVQNSGGAGLLSNQTVCDDWGCYYNQRDSQWGEIGLDGYSNYSIASDGCLVTSMAMVYTHLGHRSVNPISINSNSSNFASYAPYLLYTISADGLSTNRISADIDSTLSSGDPVVVGVNAYGGTHFVVLVSGSGGDYIMNDPYIENGHKIPFNDHYTIGSIFEIRKVVPQ
jgi:peptidoglycan hydrolase CwlO-like protein